MDIWLIVIFIYISLAVITLIPVLYAALTKIKLKPGGDSFEKATQFSEPARVLLKQHYSRIKGTLVFWKNTANKYRYFHNYCLFWTIPLSILIPIMLQNLNSDNYSKLFLTIASSHSAVLLLLHRSLKVDSNFKAFRHGESEFYDLYRRLLDRPHSFGETEEQQLSTYFEQVETIRKYVRNAETDNFPTLEEASKQASSSQKNNNE